MSSIYNIKDVYECVFLERINRFVARVKLNGEEIQVHVKNTGRCKELLINGRKGYLVKSHNEKRKYMYDLVAIDKNGLLVNIDSQLPNKVVFDYLNEENIFRNIIEIKREVTYKNSRFDIYIKHINDDNVEEEVFVEVKGVTLFKGDLALFPDAPTDRGAKHLNELVDAKENGYRACVFFLIQAEGLKKFKGNIERDIKFCNALENAFNNGVEVFCYDSKVKPEDVTINSKLEFLK